MSEIKFQEPPYSNSLELLGYIRKATPPQLQYVLEDMFETITLYDNRAGSATYRKLGDGRYEVRLKLAARSCGRMDREPSTKCRCTISSTSVRSMVAFF